MVGFLIVAFAIVLGLALVYQPFRTPSSKKGPENLPPGSMGWPLIGETLSFLKPHKSNTPGIYLEEHCARYGKVFKSRLFGAKTIISCDQELNQYILQNEEKLFLLDYPKPYRRILGELSMLIVTGEHHKKLRSNALTFVSANKTNPVFLRRIEDRAIEFMESWKGSKGVSFSSEAKRFAFALTVKQLVSMEPGDKMASRILADFETYMKGFTALPIPYPGSPYATAVNCRARLFVTVKEIMKKKREKKDSGIPDEDFLDLLLENNQLCDDERVSLVLDLLLAGYGTTATALALAVYFLSHTPDASAKLREEHQAIRESKNGEPLGWEDYMNMDFTRNVIHESLRCGNLVKFLQRKALQDVKFKGYFIPAGWRVFPMLAGANFDPDLHENPLEFNPWRWEKAEMSKRVNQFGGGLRLCPGAELAKVEVSFFLHHFVLNYRWKTKGDACPMAYPYVEFKSDLAIEIEPIEKTST